ncbi:P-loop containing nucleoside triphosphate hydrolase [Artemisia annua]|uniref:P-loop containing nucleoside triphosphate hydrolase n=1 Tax=Artemisia annua TaxID=35608 RepID=A0A2U1M522_ARTAN|nr:P-loop containing nucleoside triphosphate hydrolase [Artemisia annua]
MASTSNNITSSKRQEFSSVVFSWSLSDILNKHLYKSQVQEVPLTFSGTTHHRNTFTYLLLEETQAELHSQKLNLYCMKINIGDDALGNPWLLGKRNTDQHIRVIEGYGKATVGAGAVPLVISPLQ